VADYHSPWGPSGAERWLGCPGSIREAAKVAPRDSNVWQLEGTEAHELLEYCLRNNVHPQQVAGYDLEMQIAVATAYTYVLDNFEYYSLIESRVHVPNFGLPVDLSGKLDVALYYEEARTLHVIDYKHGIGWPVDKTYNLNGRMINVQTWYYALGAYFAMHEAVNIDHAKMTIIQPRMLHEDGQIRHDSAPVGELLELHAELIEGAKRTLEPDAPLVPGNYCKTCPAFATCPAVFNKALTVARQDFASYRDVTAESLPPVQAFAVDQLPAILTAAPHIRKWLADVEDYAGELIRSGVYVPGFKLADAMARRKYYGEPAKIAEQIVAISGGTISLDEVFPRELVALTHVEKMLLLGVKDKAKRAAIKEAFAFLTVKESSGNLTLVTSDDPRPPYNPARDYIGVTLPDNLDDAIPF
jgi:hypothetical protein